VNALEDKKGEDIILMDIHEAAFFADYFIICSGTSNRMLQALADTAIEQTKRKFEINARIEGIADHGWILVDFGDVILHLFSPDRREYYQLESLWSGGKILLHLQ
jgi:ribosome-associated protein